MNRTIGASRYWFTVARMHGYHTEKAMWQALYSKQTSGQIAAMPMMDVTAETIRNRVRHSGIAMKPPGGANHVKG